MIADLAPAAPTPRKWTVEEFQRIVDSGAFGDKVPFELSRGMIVDVLPQGEPHRLVFRSLFKRLGRLGAFEAGLLPSMTIRLADSIYDPEFIMEREPNRGVSPLTASDVLWIVEVSDTSVRKDLGVKRDVYAENGIPHYWVLDVNRRGLWIFASPLGGEYTEAAFVPEGEVPLPAHLSERSLRVEPLFADL